MERIHEGPLPWVELMASFGAQPAEGALASFAGLVRNHHQGRAVSGIRYHAHRGLAARELAAIESAIADQHGVRCALWHAVGDLAVGDCSVLVLVGSAHRAAAFAGCRDAIEAIKARLPIWKEERFADGSTAFVAGVPRTGLQKNG